MEELLSLKWNNHKNSFIHLLSILRKKSNHTDATLACDGELYNVHKLVLSACSDYFSNIFDSISCPNPVIVLKDISKTNLEWLLDYMYLGEVSVRQTDLSSLIQAAECLKLKGLAVPDDDIYNKSTSRKREADSSSPRVRKKVRKSPTKEIKPYHSNICDNESSFKEPPMHMELTANSPSVSLKKEEVHHDVFTVKEEPDVTEDLSHTWGFNSICDNEFSNYNLDQQAVENDSQFGALPSSDISSGSFEKQFNEGENLSNEAFTTSESLPASLSSLRKTVQTDSPARNQCCCYCNKRFHLLGDLKRHVRIHTGEKPFACPRCPYRATQKITMVKHVLVIHQERCT